MTTPLDALLALNATPNLGPLRLAAILRAFPLAALPAIDAEQLTTVPGVSKTAASRFCELRAECFGAREREQLAQLGGYLLMIGDPRYPPLLATLPDPPPVLYIKGELPCTPMLAIIGSRRATAYGLRQAERIAFVAGALGVCTISGLAQGIDGAAHAATLAGGGKTVAVLGCGLDRPYPPMHVELANRIAHNGAMISEYPLGSPPLAGHFPRRNRIIAGLAAGVLVVEAAARSGSLNTARIALELGREVMAIPSSVEAPTAVGPHQLIREGAALITCIEDILTLLPQLLPLVAPAEPTSPAANEPPLSHDPLQQQLLHLLRRGTFSLDGLIAEVAAPAPRVLACLCLLALAGQVIEHPGQRYGLPAA
jgi:DNA processing protein